MALDNPKKVKRIIALDRHRLGLIGGTVGALLVLVVSFWISEADILVAIIRAGWAFILCYAATVFLVYRILHTTLTEMIEEQKESLPETEEEMPGDENA
jgi:hypothetical protein